MRGVVALDGPSGTGKSTVARRLAASLGATYLDTGAMYRAVTLAVLRAGIQPPNRAAEQQEQPEWASRAVALAHEAVVAMGTDPDQPTVSLDGADVTDEIRQAHVTSAVSAVSAVPEVRETLVSQQRALIAAALQTPGGIVVEGRDIGTVVAPDAGLKVYLTASAEVRAQRRTQQDQREGRVSEIQDTVADQQRRDQYDSTRAVAPLRAADGAVDVDTTELTIPAVIEQLTKLAEQRGMLDQAAQSDHSGQPLFDQGHQS